MTISAIQSEDVPNSILVSDEYGNASWDSYEDETLADFSEEMRVYLVAHDFYEDGALFTDEVTAEEIPVVSYRT